MRNISTLYAAFLVTGIGIWALILLTPINVPLYDGVGFPDEPYRAVDGSTKTQPPTNAEGTFPVRNGTNDAVIFVFSGEDGPQVQVQIAQHDLVITPPTVQQIKVLAQPVSSDLPPTFGWSSGNAYQVTTAGDGGATIGFTGRSPDSMIVLRLPDNELKNDVVMAYKPADKGTWQRLDTKLIGSDIYQARFMGFGNYVLFHTAPKGRPPAQTKPIKKPGQETTPALAFLIPGLLLATALYLKLRTRKKKHAAKRD